MPKKVTALAKPRKRRKGNAIAIGGRQLHPKWVAVGFAVEQLGSTLSGFIPDDAATAGGILAKLKRSPTGLGLAAAGYFLKSPDVFSVGLGMAGSALTG